MGKRQHAHEPSKPAAVEVISGRHRRPGDPGASTSMEPRYEAPAEGNQGDAADRAPATADRAAEREETAATVVRVPGGREGADAAIPSRKRKRAPVIDDVRLEIVEVEAPPEEAHLLLDAVRIIAEMLIRHYHEARTLKKEAA